MKLLAKTTLFVLLNVATFYGLKYYYDTRAVRTVTALLPSVAKVSPIGAQYKYVPYPTPEGVEYKQERVGFGTMGHGSGVFISKDGLLLTCAHVVEGTPLVELSLDGVEKELAQTGYKTAGKLLAYVVGRDVEHDVALLRLVKPLKGIRAVALASSVRKGLGVVTIGFPGPFNKYVTAGTISGSLNGNIFSDVVVAPGNSGGGVFDVNGTLVGLAKGMTGPLNIPTYQGFSVLSPLDAIRELVNKYKGF